MYENVNRVLNSLTEYVGLKGINRLKTEVLYFDQLPKCRQICKYHLQVIKANWNGWSGYSRSGGLNKMTTVLGYLIGFLIYSPFNLIIHELGHAFFIKLLGGKINRIHIGVGDSLINLKGFSFNKYFFILGYVDFDYSTVKIKNKIGDFFIIFGGVLFNIISLIIIISIFNAYNPNSFLKGYYIGFTITLIISALIPVTYPNGYDSDGKNIFKLLMGNTERG